MAASFTECAAEVIEGYPDPATCWGCPDCVDQIQDDIEHGVEMGDVTEEEAHDQHVQFEQFGIIPT